MMEDTMMEDTMTSDAGQSNDVQQDQNTQTGEVKWFDGVKGYGFIAPDGDDNTQDLFVHKNDLQVRSIREGDRVSFVVKQGEKGPYATEVSLV